MEFMHACFRKDSPYLLEHIKRKIANPKPTAPTAAQQAAAVAAAATAAAQAAAAENPRTAIRPETVTKVMNEVKTMRTRQESLDSRFSAMKQENEALWREVAILRQKHAKQQQIVNKLIQFLVTLVQPARPGSGINNMSGVKRRFQLMINDVPSMGDSTAAAGGGDVSNGAATGSATGKQPADDHMPAIRELTDELFDEDEYEYEDTVTASPHVLSPAEQRHHPHNHYHHQAAEEISDDVEQTSMAFVDHPDTDSSTDNDGDEHDDHNHDDSAHEMQTVDYDIDEAVSATTSTVMAAGGGQSPTQEWLESHILSPQMIKQELVEGTGAGATVNYDHSGGAYATIDAEHTYTLPSAAAAKRSRMITAMTSPRSNRQKSGLHLHIGKNGGQQQVPAVAQIAEKKRPVVQSGGSSNQLPANRNPMISGIASAEVKMPQKISMPSTSRGTKRMAGPQQPHQNAPPSSVYVNKNDFISTEMPTELFDMRSQEAVATGAGGAGKASGSMSPMLGDLSSANFNPSLSLLPSSSSAAVSAAGASGSAAKTMAVAKYGSGKISGA